MRLVLTTLLAFITGAVLMTAFKLGPVIVTKPIQAESTVTAAPSAAVDNPSTDDDEQDDASRWPRDGLTPEQVMYTQPEQVRHALSQLTPRVAGQSNLYAVAFAGDGAEDVFRNEVEYAAKLLPARYGPTAHVLVLENHPASLTKRPLANWSNLESVLDGLHKIMQPDDILMLYFTSHGSHEDSALLVDMDPIPLDQIGPDDLADILDKHPFRWKVVVINACYSGGFIPAIKGDGTLVLTAARQDRSSFGCGSASDITYFGKAWLVDGLGHQPNLLTAFYFARAEVAQWEKADQLTPSEPQIDIGAGIEDQLGKWQQAAAMGVAPNFHAAPSLATH